MTLTGSIWLVMNSQVVVAEVKSSARRQRQSLNNVARPRQPRAAVALSTVIGIANSFATTKQQAGSSGQPTATETRLRHADLGHQRTTDKVWWTHHPAIAGLSRTKTTDPSPTMILNLMLYQIQESGATLHQISNYLVTLRKSQKSLFRFHHILGGLSTVQKNRNRFALLYRSHKLLARHRKYGTKPAVLWMKKQNSLTTLHKTWQQLPMLQENGKCLSPLKKTRMSRR
jgi:hypothetical protein